VRLRGGAAAALAFFAPFAHAHGFGQRYDLPLPLELYLTGAAFTVVVSCVLFAFYLRAAPARGSVAGLDLLASPAGRLVASAPVVTLLRAIALFAYGLVIFAGLFGHPDTFKNIAPVAVWALGWVGIAYFCALVGDFWKVVNPLDTLFAPFDRFASNRPLPMAAGWIAVLVYAAIIWMEIAWDESDSPRAIAFMILGYSIFTWAAMSCFGREAWLARGDALSRFFATLGRFAPLDIGLSARRIIRWRLRPYALGLLTEHPLEAPAVAFVIVILAGVSFDGFLETPVWQALEMPRTPGLVAACLAFALAYLLCCRIIAAIAGPTAPPWRTIASTFVMTLVPIAIAYEVAHYFSFLVQATQYLVPLTSDPFGWGWNLFGGKNVFVRVSVVDSRIVWIVSLAVIVTGHVAAIYLGHLLAMRLMPDRRSAVRSELPMLVLMVGYTMLSLWIIAQPIVTTR
jgi:hypothetical protein